jgi:hypothetical protein
MRQTRARLRRRPEGNWEAVCGTSDKFVPQPSKEDILLGDLILGIRRFAKDIRWKEFWMLKKAEEVRNVITAPSPSNRMFKDKENQRPTLITDTSETNRNAFTLQCPRSKGIRCHLKTHRGEVESPKRHRSTGILHIRHGRTLD